MLKTKYWLLPLSAALVLAADPAWNGKSIADWNEADAKQILTDSPWVKNSKPTILPQISTAQLRDGGVMRAGKSADLTELNPFRKGTKNKQDGTVVVRWESAEPVRAAEWKAGETTAPRPQGNDYVVGLYDFPLSEESLHSKATAETLRKAAVLKRTGGKDLRASSVEIVPSREGFVVLLYHFPRNGEIGKNVKRVTFQAEVARIAIAETFYPAEMQIHGQLEL